MRTIYVASRTKHAERWKSIRAAWSDTFKVNSTWLDEAGPGESESLTDLAHRCIREASEADALVVYVEPGDLPLKGVLMEVGAALASRKPVYWSGPMPSSAVMHHPGIRSVDSIHEAIALAAKEPAK